jgi:hypothetical protein
MGVVRFVMMVAVALIVGGGLSHIWKSLHPAPARQVTDDRWLDKYPEVKADPADDPAWAKYLRVQK